MDPETESKQSQSSSTCPVMQSIDKKSEVWGGITLSRQKFSYTVSDSLGPHFHEKQMYAAKKAPVFSLALYSATNERGGLAKDLELRHEEKEKVVDYVLEIIPVTVEIADELLRGITDCFEEKGLKEGKIPTHDTTQVL